MFRVMSGSLGAMNSRQIVSKKTESIIVNVIMKVRERTIYYGFQIPGSSISEYRGFRLSYLKFDFRELVLFSKLGSYGQAVEILNEEILKVDAFLLQNTIAATDAPSLALDASNSTAFSSGASNPSIVAAVSSRPPERMQSTLEPSGRVTASAMPSDSASAPESAITSATRHLERRRTHATMSSQSEAEELTWSAEVPARRARTSNDEQPGDSQREDRHTEADEDTEQNEERHV